MSAPCYRRSKSSKAAQNEHFEHVAQVWNQARSDVLNERHQQLHEKVQLQHQLLKAQDRRADIIRQEEQERFVQKRQKEKEEKQAKAAALQQICKQSLNEDKKKAAQERRAAKTTSPGWDSVPGTRSPSVSTEHSSPEHSVTDQHNGQGGPRHSRHRGYLPSMGLPDQQLPSTPMREQDGEEDEDDVFSPGSGEQELPVYQKQLYQMYGQQADYFLHPKPTEAPPEVISSHRRQTQAKLKIHKVAQQKLEENGHIGAGELWETLRKDSVTKLLKNDRKFPLELKSAFSAFVRERLTNHGKPVQRSFCASEDVPDMERLMDQSKLRRTRMYRHKTELMYRSSLINEDRTSILLHNAPMPDITETGGQPDSINRYLPSWVDDQSEVSEPDYMKWIKARQEEAAADQTLPMLEKGEGDKENVRHSAHSRQLSEASNELHNIWHSIARRKMKPKTPRYHFLTVKETQCDGGFTQKFEDEKEHREKPRPHHMTKSHSALDFTGSQSSLSGASAREPRGRSALAGQLQRYRSDWEPLSMHALIEYKQHVQTEGTGDFHNGRMKMWPARASTST